MTMTINTATTAATTARRRFQGALASAAVLLAVALAGCTTPQASRSTTALPLDRAAVAATDALMAQTTGMAGFLSKRSLVLDPMIDAATGQQTVATQTLQRRVADRLAAGHDTVQILPFRQANLAKATYLLTGTLSRQAAGVAGPLTVRLALTDVRSGNVVAQASALALEQGVDSTPLAYDQDSPVLAKDRVIDGYVRTTATPPGQRADAQYLERLAAAPVIDEATTLYNAGRYQEALTQYNAAGASPAGDQLRVLSGIYLSSVKLERTAEAEQAFAKIVDYGIRNKQLGVKFLFNPGTTVFWSDAKVSGSYAMWLQQIARLSTQAAVCFDVVGHTSRTGSEPVNDALSLQRANAIRQKLVAESTVLANRTRASGKGFRENIIGSGSDDAVDALDRRVEFKIVGCGA
ncbi:OmpA family protein [Variovorax sp. LT2P21]|uniref:OmpA family protein n=1 Tax=Variovorax sp. LT2P21 TaxID=3443731 RepID=UPI003F482A48